MRDFVSNNNPVAVYKMLDYFQKNDLMPDFLESYEIPSVDSMRKYSSTAFADVNGRSFPIHEPAATLLSAACFYGEDVNSPEIEGKIVKAAAAQGVSDWLELVKLALEGHMTKQASAISDDFALVVDDGNSEAGYLPISDLYSVQESARSLSAAIHNREIPLISAAEAASRIVKRASEFGMTTDELPNSVVAFAEKRIFDPAVASTQLNLRKSLVGEETAGLYEDIFKSASAIDADLDAHVELIEDLDRDFINFSKDGYRGLKDAWESLHGGMTEESFQKLANSYAVLTFDGDDNICEVPVAAFRSIPDTLIKTAFSKSEGEHISQILSGSDETIAEEINQLRDDIKADLLKMTVKFA